jgi:hypothetical protein
METDFLGIVMRCYAYLVTDYGFLIKKSDISARDPDIDGEVEFVSSTTFVSVSGEQGTLLVEYRMTDIAFFSIHGKSANIISYPSRIKNSCVLLIPKMTQRQSL